MSITSVNNLQTELQRLLPLADELWVAIALMNESGFTFLEQTVSSTAIRNYVVGVDLPTSPDVLRELMQREKAGVLSARIFKTKKYFHPKLYILRTGTSYTAFVGSGNCTTGGLSNNVELSIKITDSAQCLELINNYFNNYFREATPITEKFLEGYQPIFTRRKARIEEDEQDVAQIVVASNPKQFFKPEHHVAFEPRRWEDKSREALRLRQAVVDRFLELHEQIYPIQFRQHGLLNLHAHYQSNYTTSLAEHKEGFNAKQLKSVWLHYGKPEHQIREYQKLLKGLGQSYRSKGDTYDQQSFINHIRIQVIIHHNDVGIWLVIGKDNGSLFDRQHIKDNLRDELKTTSETRHISTNSSPNLHN
jgi:HKD family nuclease